MQKLQAKFKNVPRNAPQVPCDTTPRLNREETLSVKEIVLTRNIPEVDHLQHRGGSDLRVQNIVYVLNKRGFPLMPTTQARSRRLLKGGKADVVKRFPFTIQLTGASGENKQALTLGVDAGYKTVGLSAVSPTQELFSSEVSLRSDIVKLLSERLMYRRGRRNKLQYREPRFNNRISSKKEGWLAPSIQHKLDSHIRLVDRVHRFLPVTGIIIETASFDIQKIMNPEIEGIGYQNGVQTDFRNTHAYVLHRDHYTCQHCGKQEIKLRVHHLESRQTGSDSPDNLLTLCEDCHEKLHEGKIKLKQKKTRGFRPETFMSTVNKKLVELLKQKYSNVSVTFGYITKSKRKELGLEKSHAEDAFVIAGGEEQSRSYQHSLKQKRRNNRCLQTNRKGFKPSIRRQRYSIQPHDMVTLKNTELTAVGVFNKGSYVRLKDNKDNILNVNIKKVEKVFHVGGLIWN